MVARKVAQVGQYSITVVVDEPIEDAVTMLDGNGAEVCRGPFVLPMVRAAERLVEMEATA